MHIISTHLLYDFQTLQNTHRTLPSDFGIKAEHSQNTLHYGFQTTVKHFLNTLPYDFQTKAQHSMNTLPNDLQTTAQHYDFQTRALTDHCIMAYILHRAQHSLNIIF